MPSCKQKKAVRIPLDDVVLTANIITDFAQYDEIESVL